MATNGKTTLASALLAFQADAPALQKDKINPHFRSKYLSLEALMEQVLPVLNSHGLVLVQQPSYISTSTGTETEKLVASLTTKLVHGESGEEISSTMLLMAAKDDPQGQGSAITYARRQAAMSLLGLVADADDDANRANRKPPAKTRASSPKPEPAAATPEPAPTPEAADKPTGDADERPQTPDNAAETKKLVDQSLKILEEIQEQFGDHPEGMTWLARMGDKCQEWFGHGIEELTTAEAKTLLQRLRATRTKLLSEQA